VGGEKLCDGCQKRPAVPNGYPLDVNEDFVMDLCGPCETNLRAGRLDVDAVYQRMLTAAGKPCPTCRRAPASDVPEEVRAILGSEGVIKYVNETERWRAKWVRDDDGEDMKASASSLADLCAAIVEHERGR